MKKIRGVSFFLLVFIISFSIFGCGSGDFNTTKTAGSMESSAGGESSTQGEGSRESGFCLENIPEYSGSPYVVINGNVPYFSEDELTDQSFESYSELDSLGRCGVCTASVGLDIMPAEERGNISSVKATGWHTAEYDGVVEGSYLYNRCHLIGFQLTGENANEKNLITGTRYLNVEGMLPFENMVADYVKETGNHVLYRVTPVFEGDNLLASGVLMEAESVEDEGEGILFHVYCYNVQPGIVISYGDGSSRLAEGSMEPAGELSVDGGYAVNGRNGKIHKTGGCAATESGSGAMDDPVYFDTYEEAEEYSVRIAPGLEKRQCGNCW